MVWLGLRGFEDEEKEGSPSLRSASAFGKFSQIYIVEAVFDISCLDSW